MADQENPLGLDEETLNRTVDIEYYGTEEVLGIFADQAMISHSNGLFTLLFFQMQFPPMPTAEQLRALRAIPARCVSRVVLTPMLMQQFAVAINGNLEKYDKSRLPTSPVDSGEAPKE